MLLQVQWEQTEVLTLPLSRECLLQYERRGGSLLPTVLLLPDSNLPQLRRRRPTTMTLMKLVSAPSARSFHEVRWLMCFV